MKFKHLFFIVLFAALTANFVNSQSTNFKVIKSEIFKDKNTNSELIFSRITSYNVCYTKLLRANFTQVSFAVKAVLAVIPDETSPKKRMI